MVSRLEQKTSFDESIRFQRPGHIYQVSFISFSTTVGNMYRDCESRGMNFNRTYVVTECQTWKY